MEELPPELTRVLQEHNVDVGDGALLTLALTHKSWVNEKNQAHHHSNERLEFLGDAVIELAISDVLYDEFPLATEGDLARMRAAVVCESSLAGAGGRLGLGKALRMSYGEEKSGGRSRASLLANTYEALMGAIYLLCGWETARQVILQTLSVELEQTVVTRAPADPKSRLQEFLQALYGDPPIYRLVDEKGPDHDKTFFTEVQFDGKTLGRGQGHSKRASEQAAAREALRRLSR